MLNLHRVRDHAEQLAQRVGSVPPSELRVWFMRLTGEAPDDAAWPTFRAAYFDALWAGAHELAASPVIAHSEFPKGRKLTAAGHLTLAFVATERLEMVEMTIEAGEA